MCSERLATSESFTFERIHLEMSVENCCEKEIEELKEELKRWSDKSNQLKQEYGKKLIENLKKDLIIRDLKENIKLNKFSSFKGVLSAECLSALKSVDESKGKDSVFICYALKDLYAENIDVLKHLTLSSPKNSDKTQISSENKKVLEGLFAERLSYIRKVDHNRINSLSKLIRNTVDNLNKTNKQTKS